MDPLSLIFFKNLIHKLKYSISNLFSKSLDEGIMVNALKYSIIKHIKKKTSLNPDVLTKY